DIDPFDEARLRPAAIELTLDDFVVTPDGNRFGITDGQSFTLRTGRAVNASTKEWTALPADHLGHVGAMTRLARMGIVVSHGFQVDPGFKGNLQFCIFNASGTDFALREGDPIVSLEIVALHAPPSVDANSTRPRRNAGDRDRPAAGFRNEIGD